MLTLIRNAQLVLPDRIYLGYIVVENGTISQIDAGSHYPDLPYHKVLDLQGKYLAPGFVELHTHGAGGCDLWTVR